MAKLPTTLGERRVPQPQRGVVAVRPGIVEGAMLESAKLQEYAIQRFGQDLRQVSEDLYANEQKAKELARRQALSDARIGAFSDLSNAQLNFDVSSDPTTAADRWKSESDKIYEKYSKSLQGDPALASAFKEDFENKRLAGSIDVRSQAVKSINDKAVASLDGKTDTLLTMLSTNADPVREQQIVDEMRLLTADAEQSGVITAEDGGKRLRDFASKGMEAKARGDIINNPVIALAKLNDPNSYRGLDDVKRTTLVDMATRRVDSIRSDQIRLAEKADRDAEKNLKKQSDETFKTLLGLSHDGTLTRDDVETAKAILDPTDYDALLTDLDKQAKPEDVKDDPNVVADFETRVDNEDIRGDLVGALKRNEISVPTFRSLMQKNRELRKPGSDDGPPTPLRSGRDFVKTTLNPGDLLSDQAAAIARAGLANALVEYDNWSEAHPEASRAEAQQQANDIVSRYQVVNYSQMSLATGLPNGYVGTRNDLKPEDLDRAEDQTIADLEAKNITEAQAAQELRKINNWRAILEKKATEQ